MGTSIAILVALALLVVLLVTTIILLLGRTAKGSDVSPALSLMQQQLDSFRQQTAEALTGNTRTVNDALAGLNQQLNGRLASLDKNLLATTGLVGARLDAANRVVQELSTSLGELSKATQQVYEVGKDISSLQDILRAPKLRGMFGELFLGDLLRQVVPSNHELQHRFRSGEIVDAVVLLSSRMVPIDAKFPLEDFQRLIEEKDEGKQRAARRRFVAGVRKHVDAIATKYILPDEGTFDFALMYIPAENVYYETIIRHEPGEDGITDYALSRRVIPVSPNSLYAYLQAIVLGLRGFQIEKRAEEILRHLGRLQQEFGRFREEFEVVGTHITHARNKYEEAAKRLAGFEDKLAISVDPEGSDSPALSKKQE